MFLSQRRRKAQSLIEYTILFCVVVSALLLLQAIVKRGFSGNLRESADRMGEQYSPSNTTTRTTRTMGFDPDVKKNDDQYINEEVNTTKTTATNFGIDKFIPPGYFKYTPKYVGDLGVYSYTERLDQKFTSKTEEKTDSAAKELFGSKEYEKQATTWPDFPDTFSIP